MHHQESPVTAHAVYDMPSWERLQGGEEGGERGGGVGGRLCKVACIPLDVLSCCGPLDESMLTSAQPLTPGNTTNKAKQGWLARGCNTTAGSLWKPGGQFEENCATCSLAWTSS